MCLPRCRPAISTKAMEITTNISERHPSCQLLCNTVTDFKGDEWRDVNHPSREASREASREKF